MRFCLPDCRLRLRALLPPAELTEPAEEAAIEEAGAEVRAASADVLPASLARS